MTGLEYRSYFMSTLYGPLANLLKQDATTQGTWIGTYGATGYDIVAGPASLPAGATVTPAGQSTYIWTTTTTDPRALQVPGSSSRVAAVWYSPTSFTVDVNLTDGQAHDLELYFDDWDNKGRAETVQISDAATGARAEHAVDLVVPVGGVPGLRGQRPHRDHDHQDGRGECRPQRPLPRPVAHGDARQAGHDDAGDVDRHLRRHRLRHRRRPRQPARLRHGHARRASRPTSGPRPPPTPAPCRSPARPTASPPSGTPPPASPSTSTSPTGRQHDLELYFVDWDNKGRAETVQISDAATGAVLSTQSISSFQSGVYLDYAVSGHIVITITRTAGANAVLNGLFLDPSSTATPVKQDTTTQGTWIGTYGATGYDIVAGPASLPAYDTVTPAGQSTYTWTTTTTDPRALQVPGSSNRVAAVWYSATSFTVDVNLADGQQHDLELYFDRLGQQGPGRDGADQRRGDGRRAEHAVDLVVPVGCVPGLRGQRPHRDHDHQDGRGECRPQRPLPRPVVHGDARPSRTRRRRGRGSAPTAPPATTSSPAPPASPPTPRSRPPGSRPTPGPPTTTDPRALQVPGSSNRVAAVWYSATSFTVDVNLTDGATHDLELYFDDWDNKGRAETVQISDAATGAVLSTQSISSFQSGVYLDYAVSGHIVITITRTAGANAVLNGLFLDPSSTATLVRQDTATQGTWIGTYGATGYDIVSGPSSLPAGDTVTPSGQSTYTWTTTSTDPRALQVPGSSNRVAAVWYSPTSFTVDVNLTDGQQHDLELYFDDWDNKGRAETVQISDAVSGAVLSTQSISSFQSGVYLDYAVSGHIVITITRTAGANAVLNGLFLD